MKDIEAIRKLYGFDKPVYQQYLLWAGRAVAGDFGESYHYKAPVSEMIAGRIGTTVTLGTAAILFALIVSIPLGTIAAMRPNSLIDRIALFIAVIGQALPTFWFALMMIIVFGVWWRMLPISGNTTWQHFVMPTIALGYYATPALMRLTRAGMIRGSWVRLYKDGSGEGLRPISVLFKHALRNAIIPVVSLAAVWFWLHAGRFDRHRDYLQFEGHRMVKLRRVVTGRSACSPGHRIDLRKLLRCVDAPRGPSQRVS